MSSFLMFLVLILIVWAVINRVSLCEYSADESRNYNLLHFSFVWTWKLETTNGSCV
jgi:hypothetical protein